VAWANDDMVLYHGCSDRSLRPANPNGISPDGGPHNISPSVGAARPDFGPGFYTTTWLHQARNWANMRVRRQRAGKAVVLSMRLARNHFANLQSLVFPSDRDKFYDFVGYCRTGGIPHAPRIHRERPYDVVAGPVTAAPQTLAIGQADQVSFHTAVGILAISHVTVFEIGNPLLNVMP
jgi:Protein of unknown function (DUF3990)